MLEKKPLDDDAGRADQDRRHHQRFPIADAEILQHQIGGEGAHHVLRPVGEVDDVKHAENDREPEAQERVERAVDQAEQQLTEQRLRGDTENLEHPGALCSQNSEILEQLSGVGVELAAENWSTMRPCSMT